MPVKRLLTTTLLAAALTVWGADAIPWKLPVYSLVARDMDLRVALDSFATAEGIPVVMSSAVIGVFSGDFNEVPPAEFLDKIATLHNLIWYYDGAALYLYGAGEIQSVLIDLQYMKAVEVRAMLKELGVEDGRFPLKTTSNDELVMVSGPSRYVALVAEMIAKADKLRQLRTFNEVETRLFPLTHTWADDVSFNASSPETAHTLMGVANILQEIMSGEIGKKTHDSLSTNTLSAAEQEKADAFRPIIRAENRLNAVLVRDVTSRMPMYEDLIRKLDIPQKLVEIDVTVVELSRKDALDWQLSIAASGSHGNNEIAGGQNAGNLFDTAGVGGKGLAGALAHIASDYSLGASLTALREKGKARSISRTSLLTVNNLAASMSDIQSYNAKVIGTEVASIQEVSAGTTLQIKPRILPSGQTNMPDQVWLSISLDDGGFESVTVDAMPMKRSTALQTQTAVFAEDSIMLAGYFRDIDEKAGWGIPFLRDIPLIGWLFGGKSTKKETVQRMFLITPHIVDLDIERLARAQAIGLRDITVAEEVEDGAAASDDERERRELERKYNRRRREEKAEDALRRRAAELEHDEEMRQLERVREHDRLVDDVRSWQGEEGAARERLFKEAAAREAAAEEARLREKAEAAAREAAAEEARLREKAEAAARKAAAEEARLREKAEAAARKAAARDAELRKRAEDREAKLQKEAEAEARNAAARDAVLGKKTETGKAWSAKEAEAREVRRMQEAEAEARKAAEEAAAN